MKNKGPAFKVNMPGTTPGTKGQRNIPQNIAHKPTIRTKVVPKTPTASQKLELLEDRGQR